MKGLLDILWVFLGGGAGAVCRHLIELSMRYTGAWLGTAVWIINTVGCFIIGIIAGYLMTSTLAPASKHTIYILTVVGFCGGFTAFSSFTLDCVKYFTEGKVGAALVYITLTMLAGLFSTGVGVWAGTKF